MDELDNFLTELSAYIAMLEIYIEKAEKEELYQITDKMLRKITEFKDKRK